MSISYLETPIEFLKGVGPQRADMLKKELDVFTFYDLLHCYPFRYVDRSKFYKVRDVHANLPYIQIRGYISHIELSVISIGIWISIIFIATMALFHEILIFDKKTLEEC